MGNIGDDAERIADVLEGAAVGGAPIHVWIDSGPLLTDWLMVFITGLGVLSTLLIGLLTYRANRTAGLAVREAALANDRLSAQQMERLESIAAMSSQGTAGGGVRWQIDRVGRSNYRLRNVGRETAYNVTIEQLNEDPDVPDDLHVAADEAVTLTPDADLPFGIERSLASAPVTIVVIRWQDQTAIPFADKRIVR